MVIILPLFLGIAPSLVWLFFFLKEDVHPEPKKMILKIYIIGGLSSFIALFFEYVANLGMNDLLQKDLLFGWPINSFIVFSIIEETVKFLAIYLFLRRNKFFDEPIDAMIYMVTGALGFAAAENVFLVFSDLDGALSLMLLRFIGATLLHALASAIIGHYWARGIRFKMEWRLITIGIIVASTFHAIFNTLVFKFNDLIIYPTVFLVFLGFFVLYDFEELKKIEETCN